MRIYIASKTAHAPLWRHMRAQGVPFVSTWIDEAGHGDSPDKTDLWRRKIVEASTADALILYCEPGEELKGALVEVGAALAATVPVFWVGPIGRYTVWHHAGVRPSETVEAALLSAGVRP